MPKNESRGSGITLTNNKIKDIINVVRSLENRRILLKEITRKTTSQERRFLNFLEPIMSAGLLLMKNELTSLASVSVPLELTLAASATDVTILKEVLWIRYDNINIFKWTMHDLIKIVKSLEEVDLLIKGVSETVGK